MTARLKVLVVDDEPVARRLAMGSLRSEYDLCEARNGEEALVVFQAVQPDVVLLDVEMPGMDGVQAAAELKRLAGSRFVPIFLVSGAEGFSTLARGLAAGADDFLPKPFDHRVFSPKLQVFLRLRAQHQHIAEQNRALDAYRRETKFEHSLAQHIFERLERRAELTGAKVLHTSFSEFNGDAVLAAVCPNGKRRYLVADVTGHGLNAALGTLPVSALFYFSTARGDSMGFTMARINDELHQSLPASIFVSAAVLELDPVRGRLELINAGMPPIFVKRARELFEFPSVNVPLGVMSEWTPTIEHIDLQRTDLVMVMSDGLIERADASGDLFGAQRVRELLSHADESLAFELLVRATEDFAPGRDDVTLLAFGLEPVGASNLDVERSNPTPREPVTQVSASKSVGSGNDEGAVSEARETQGVGS